MSRLWHLHPAFDPFTALQCKKEDFVYGAAQLQTTVAGTGQVFTPCFRFNKRKYAEITESQKSGWRGAHRHAKRMKKNKK